MLAIKQTMDKHHRKKTSFIRPKPGDIVFNVVNIAFFTMFMLICIFPFYYLFINTISDNDLSSRGLIYLLPKGIHFQNYAQVFKLEGLFNATLVSLARTVFGTTLTVFASAFVGYLMSKRNMLMHKTCYRFILITMYFNAGIIPWYINMMNLRLINNFLAYILPSIVSPFNIILVKTYVESIPSALEDAAQIDGAGYLTRFIKVVLPICIPILATITIFSAVGQWNAFQDTLFLVSDTKLHTLQFILYRYMNEATALATIIKSSESSDLLANLSITQTPTSIKMTVSMIVVMPILLVYPFFQRYFVKGIMIGSVKG